VHTLTSTAASVIHWEEPRQGQQGQGLQATSGPRSPEGLGFGTQAVSSSRPGGGNAPTEPGATDKQNALFVRWESESEEKNQ
jgi:hypothetical protein